MGSVRLHLFKTERINFVNLFQFCFMLSRRDLYQPCRPMISGPYLEVIKGQLIYDFSPEDPDNFRNIEWNEKLHSLDDLLQLTNRSIVIGNHNIDQILFLKDQYQSIAQTISCSYTEADYDWVLTHVALYHLKLQSAGVLPTTDHDHKIRSDPSIDLLSYYKTSFDQQGIIPKSALHSTDYSVPLKDFFNKEVFFQHLANIGADPTPEASDYYDQWRRLQQSYFTLEPNYESN